jgi:hypothetical protein
VQYAPDGTILYSFERCSGSTCTNFASVGSTTGLPTPYHFSENVPADVAIGGTYRHRYRVTTNTGTPISGYSNIVTSTIPACATATPTPVPSQIGWVAPDGSACTTENGSGTNYAVHYTGIACLGLAGYRTQLIFPQSPCSTDGSGVCFKIGGAPVSRASQSQWWYHLQQCMPEGPGVPALTYERIDQCRWNAAVSCPAGQTLVMRSACFNRSDNEARHYDLRGITGSSVVTAVVQARHTGPSNYNSLLIGGTTSGNPTTCPTQYVGPDSSVVSSVPFTNTSNQYVSVRSLVQSKAGGIISLQAFPFGGTDYAVFGPDANLYMCVQ